eukprot:5911277-Amphidinium_carterae.1
MDASSATLGLAWLGSSCSWLLLLFERLRFPFSMWASRLRHDGGAAWARLPRTSLSSATPKPKGRGRSLPVVPRPSSGVARSRSPKERSAEEVPLVTSSSSDSECDE